MKFNIMLVSNRIKDKIIELLTHKVLTNKEISEALEKNIEKIQVYTSILFKEGQISILNDKKPYIYKSITAKSLFNYLYNLILKHKDRIEPFFDEKDKRLIKMIEELKRVNY